MNTNPSGLTAALVAESSSNYKTELCRAMSMLAEDERVVFIGQGVEDKGTFMSTTLEQLPSNKRWELPVAEEMQAGMAIGLALAGYVPVCIYPRFQFLLLAMNQLVNHIDVMQPHVIVRVGVGSTTPLDPGPQHQGDLTEGFRLLLRHTPVVRLDRSEKIVSAYQAALNREGPTILVEIADLYES